MFRVRLLPIISSEVREQRQESYSGRVPEGKVKGADPKQVMETRAWSDIRSQDMELRVA